MNAPVGRPNYQSNTHHDGISGTDTVVPISASGPVSSINKDPSGRIEPHEIEEARAAVREAFKVASRGRDFTAKTLGYNITVKLYIRPEELKTITRDDGSQATLYLPDTVRADDPYNTSVGLVIDMGEEAYCGENKSGVPRFRKPWVSVGSWVVFKRVDSIRLTYRGVALSIMTDDNVVMVVDDPTDVSTGQLEYKI